MNNGGDHHHPPTWGRPPREDPSEAPFATPPRFHGGRAGNFLETRVLNRIIRVTEDGWEYEADQRHADLIVEGLGLSQAKSALTPGEKGKSDLGDDPEVIGMEHQIYRTLRKGNS